jgi:hypothetical protein
MFKIFDYPWGLITIAIVAFVALLIFRRISPDKYRWWQWFLPALLIVAAFGLDLLVETDLEKINAVINTGVKAVEDEDPDSIEPIISDNYSDSFHSTKRALMSRCRVELSEPLVEKNIKRMVSVDIQPQKATAIFTVRILFDKQSYVYQNFKTQMLTKVQADLQKQLNNQWLISRVELLAIDLQPADWKDIR